MAELRFRDVSKRFPDGTQAVERLTLDAADGEFMVLVGPSGSGKTTALRMVAGLEQVSSGEIEIGGRTVNDVAPRDRDIAMVFQNYALYPHMTAADNMSFGLRLRKTPRDVATSRVRRAAGMLGIDGILAKKPGALSGGQRQRIAMGRAVVRQPQVFLMDEPLSNLDAQLRVQVRAEIQEMQRELGVTMLYVTHDQVEAMTLGHRVAVFREGRLEQVATPEDLYLHPASTFVAAFVGSPSMNLLPGRIVDEGGSLVARFAGGSAPLTEATLAAHDLGGPGAVGREVVVGLRPEAIGDGPVEQAGVVHGRVELVELLGADALVYASLPDDGDAKTRLVARFGGDAHRRMAHGDACELRFDAGSIHLFDASSGATLRRS
jgi:multiple sugar transport system ATP-binding protein